MKYTKLFYTIFILMFGFQAYGQWIIDKQYDFKINIPEKWLSAHYFNNNKLLYTFISSDNNIMIELEVFNIESGNRIFDLVSDYETNQLPHDFSCMLLKDYISSNSVQGKVGIYNGNINEKENSISVYYVIHNGKGYILSTLVSIEKLQETTGVITDIIDSFGFLE